MMQMMQTFQNHVMGVGVVPNGVQSVPGQLDRHLANARLDERVFRRLEKLTNKREDWREWKMHFMSSIRECDATFADYLWAIEKRQGSDEDVEVDFVSLDLTQTQLAGALSSRLIDVTTGEVFRIVEMNIGNGMEA